MPREKKSNPLRRVNILIPSAMYDAVNARGWKLSASVREALEDALSSDKITLAVGPETKALYHELFHTTSCSDADIEPYFRKALREMIDSYIAAQVERLSEIKDKLR